CYRNRMERTKAPARGTRSRRAYHRAVPSSTPSVGTARKTKATLKPSLAPLRTLSRRTSRPSISSEIHLLGDRDVIVEQMLIVLRAHLFEQRLPHAPIAPRPGPWLVESVRVLHREGHVHGLTVLGHFPAFHHVQFFRVRRAVRIDDGLGAQPDGVDDKRVALVVTDRLAIP